MSFDVDNRMRGNAELSRGYNDLPTVPVPR